MSLRTFIPILELSDEATAKIDAYDLTGFDGAPIDGADQPVKGFAQYPAEVGAQFSNIALGVGPSKASGIIAKGDRLVTVDAKTVKKAPADAENAFATALTAAGDGEFVDYLIK